MRDVWNVGFAFWIVCVETNFSRQEIIFLALEITESWVLILVRVAGIFQWGPELFTSFVKEKKNRSQSSVFFLKEESSESVNSLTTKH